MTVPHPTGVLVVIPARGGSKGIPRKNLRRIGNATLLELAIRCARESGVAERICVTTDDNEIADVADREGTYVVRRPPVLATDHAPVVAAVVHALRTLESENYRPETVLLLQPTSPLRLAVHVREATQLYVSRRPGCVISVTECEHHPQKMLSMNGDGTLAPLASVADLGRSRQELPPIFRQNGAIYVIAARRLLEAHSFYVEPALAYVMKRRDSVDVDTIEDLDLAEIWASRGHDIRISE